MLSRPLSYVDNGQYFSKFGQEPLSLVSNITARYGCLALTGKNMITVYVNGKISNMFHFNEEN